MRFTEVATPDSLLQSWGTILAARQQGWPQRAVEIGQVLRGILSQLNVDPASVSGLHALIWLRADEKGYRKMMVMGAGAGTEWIRWLPTMDLVMTSPDQLMTKMFGRGSASYRRQLGVFLRAHDWVLGFARCVGRRWRPANGRAHRVQSA